MKICFLLLLAQVLHQVAGFYSPYFRKCRVGVPGMDVGSFTIQRVHRYEPDFTFPETGINALPIQYKDIDFMYVDFIGAGGSGEVYLVEDEISHKLKILKRFFKQKTFEFFKENFIMNRMNYPIQWHHEDNTMGKPTLATYEYGQSTTLNEIELETPLQYTQVFYKICKEIEKSHRNGIIHHDIKMANTLVTKVDDASKVVDITLIDWNLATFYFPGFQSGSKQGTPCLYSPEQLLRTSFITPATDIWTVAAMYFVFIADRKPFTIDCKDEPLIAIASLVGSQKMLQLIEKYTIYNNAEYKFLKQMKDNPHKYEGITLRERIPSEYESIFDEQLIDLLEKMMQVDPEDRLTISQVLNHPYFDRIKRLPPMYKQKNNDMVLESESKHVPANNLVSAKDPKLEEKSAENVKSKKKKH